MDLCNCTDITYSFNLLSTSLIIYLDDCKAHNNMMRFQRKLLINVTLVPLSIIGWCFLLIHADRQSRFHIPTKSKQQIYFTFDLMKEVCSTRKHSITSFHSLAYDKFCDPDGFEKKCENFSEDTNSQSSRQCEQILQYERGVAYDEWVIGWLPFCRSIGVGASQISFDASPSTYTAYNQMSPDCRVTTILSMVIFYLLAIAIIIANITVLLVVRLDQYFHTPYGYFKASIAVADLLVGVLVIPALLYQFYVETYNSLSFNKPGEFPDLKRSHSPIFLYSVGIFTILTLSVSVYCLAASSFDRYVSISRPFQYEAKHFFTKKRALILILVIWILSAIYGIFPLMTKSTTYGMVSATYILAAEVIQGDVRPIVPWISLFNSSAQLRTNHSRLRTGLENQSFSTVVTEAVPVEHTTSMEITHGKVKSNSQGMYLILTMYLLSLFIPLLFVWVVNICTIRAFRRKNQKSKETFSNKQIQPQCRFEKKEHIHHSSSLCISSCGSLDSIHTAVAEDTKCKEHTLNLEKHVQEKLQSASKNSQCLSVPMALSYPRKSLPNQHTQINPLSCKTALSRCHSATSSLHILQKESVRKEKSKNSGGNAGSRMQRILLRMVIAFTICLLPAICTLIMHLLLAPYTDPYNTQLYSRNTKLFQNIFSYISSVFLFGNSFVNCIIYTVLGKRFREVTRKLYAGKVSKIRGKIRLMSVAVGSLTKKEDDMPKTKHNQK